MAPAIRSLDKVRLSPASKMSFAVGDVVLAEVDGHHYLHRIVQLDRDRRRALLRGDEGVVNGWAEFTAIAGVCTHVRGHPVHREG